jgi:uncharacterized protein (UPF0333 family)
MKNYQKGFAPLLILLVVVIVAAIGGGTYVAVEKQKKNDAKQKDQLIVTASSTEQTPLAQTELRKDLDATTSTETTVKTNTTQSTPQNITAATKCGVVTGEAMKAFINGGSATVTPEPFNCFFKDLASACSASVSINNDGNKSVYTTLTSVSQNNQCLINLKFINAPAKTGFPLLSGKSMLCKPKSGEGGVTIDPATDAQSAILGLLLNVTSDPKVSFTGTRMCSGTAVTAADAARAKNLNAESSARSTSYAATPLMCTTVTNLTAATKVKPFFGPKVEVVEFLEGSGSQNMFNGQLGTFIGNTFTATKAANYFGNAGKKGFSIAI